MKKMKVAVIMGSDSDLPVMQEAVAVLEEFKIPFEVMVLSAHRSLKETIRYIEKATRGNVQVVIAGAGGAAHLPGVVAGLFPLPVIGVPIMTSTLHGLDSLYAMVQMPPGVPVATVGINGAKNAGLLAVEILAVADQTLKQALLGYKRELARSVQVKSRRLRQLGVDRYLKSIQKG